MGILTQNGCAAKVNSFGPQPPFAAVNNGSLIIAHRGGSLEAPENTLAAIKHGVSVGSDWQEIDVTLTSDGEVVVIHDDTLDRTTEGHGAVESSTLKEIKALRAGKPRVSPTKMARLASAGITVPDFGNTYSKEQVPTLDEVLHVPDAHLMIELKKTQRVDELAKKVISAIRRARASERVALGSFEFELLDAVHTHDPSLALVGIIEDIVQLPKLLELPLSVVACSTELVMQAKEKIPPGVALWTWTVYSVEQARQLVEAGVHGLITDVPARVLQALRMPY